jgi:hypothetical protein
MRTALRCTTPALAIDRHATRRELISRVRGCAAAASTSADYVVVRVAHRGSALTANGVVPDFASTLAEVPPRCRPALVIPA